MTTPARGLRVVADDFGLTHGVCAGILEAHRHGVVTAASAMVCVPDATERIQAYAASAPPLGLHLQLTRGAPCLPTKRIPLLVTNLGVFPDRPVDLAPPSPEFQTQVREEWRAQFERLRGLGVEPAHLDSHHHVHARDDLFPVYRDLALEWGLPARGFDPLRRDALRAHGVATADLLVLHWNGERGGVPELLRILDQAFAELEEQGIHGGLVELMTHPGRCDASLERISSYARLRQRELETLRAPALRRGLAERRITLQYHWTNAACSQ
jgi:chitin disaccharide deacetylase